MIVYQENALDFADAGEIDQPKFIVGARLVYRGPSDETPPLFVAGDIVIVCESNGCGMGIDARRADGVTDMVWPWEVDIAAPCAPPTDAPR